MFYITDILQKRRKFGVIWYCFAFWYWSCYFSCFSLHVVSAVQNLAATYTTRTALDMVKIRPNMGVVRL